MNSFDLSKSSAATLGELCDAINATGAYHCTLSGFHDWQTMALILLTIAVVVGVYGQGRDQ